MNKFTHSLLGLVALGVLVPLALAGCSDVNEDLNTPTYSTGLKADELKMSAFKDKFPKQYASYMKNNECTLVTEYKTSIPYEKHNDFEPLPKGFKYAQPYLKNLWLGYPFSFEYNEARGHTYALEDFVNIDRLNRFTEGGDLPTTCWNCKTPKMMEWVAQYGDKLWSMPVNFFRDKVDVKEHPISCPTCHDPQTMKLRLYSEPAKDLLKRMGKDPDKLSRAEMRSMVCAQCHVEYYFTHKDNGPAARPVFPHDMGMNPEDLYQYYKKHGAKNGPFADWVHPISKTPMIKMQHPEYEMWIDGPHGAAGVSCADCHMQYVREDGKKTSSHWLTSPLRDPEMRVCRQCHADKTADYLKERVIYSQRKTFAQLLKAQEMSVKAHEAVRLAMEYTGERAPDYDAKLAEAREMVRKGQLFWDYVSAENSAGFHNPAKALDTVMSSVEFSQRAIDCAMAATKYGIGEALQGDIKQIVPPIRKLSRKLMQDPEYLQQHVWTKYLKPAPKAPQIFDGQKRLDGKTTPASM